MDKHCQRPIKFLTFRNHLSSLIAKAFTISEKLIEFWVNNSVFYPISILKTNLPNKDKIKDKFSFSLLSI